MKSQTNASVVHPQAKPSEFKSLASILIVCATLAGCSGGSEVSSVAPQPAAIPASPPPPPPASMSVTQCQSALSDGIQDCLGEVSTGLEACYARGGGTDCTSKPDSVIVSALADFTDEVGASCASPQLQTLGLPTSDGVLNSLIHGQCLRPLTTAATRAYGGPQARALSANIGNDFCFVTAFDEAASFLERASEIFASCAASGNCSNVANDLDDIQSTATSTLSNACTGNQLRDKVGLTPTRFLQRTRIDAECQAATLYPNLMADLACTPRNEVDAVQVWEYPNDTPTAVFTNQTTDGSPSPITRHKPERGQFVQVEIDADSTGAKCGNNSNYRFWLQLAPQGYPLDRVLFFGPGGGACTNLGPNGNDCAGPVAGALGLTQNSLSLLNTRSDDVGPSGGQRFFSTLDAQNPYQNFTKIVLTYCTQDIYTGGQDGAQDVTVDINGTSFDYTIQRTGGHNVREAGRYARDALIAAMATEGDVYDPANVEAVVAGASAGGFFSTYNYHFVLDELGWANANQIHLTGLSLDDGGVAGDNQEAIITTFRDDWNLSETFAPYCQEAECVHTPFHAERHFERLDRDTFNRQHISIITAQADPGQTKTTGFVLPDGSSDFVLWGNTLRKTYCDMRDAAVQGGYSDGLHFHLPAAMTHGLSHTQSINGLQPIYDWAADLENDFVVSDAVDASTNIIGPVTLDPFPCPVGN